MAQIDKPQLQSNYQNPGDIYSDGATEACFEIVADAHNETDARLTKAVANAVAPGAVDSAKLANRSVTRTKIDIGAVGAEQIDPALFQQYGDIALNARFGKIDNQLADITLNVKSYGAVGDGIADDSIPIQAALDAVHDAGGGTVLIPGGTYRIGNFLKVYSSTRVMGVIGKTIIKKTPTVFYVFRLSSVSNVVIEYITMDGDIPSAASDWSDEQKHNIAVTNSNNVFIRNCTSINAGGDGVYVGGLAGYSQNVVVENCVIHKVGRNGISLVAACFCKAIGNRISGARGPILGVGIDNEPNAGDTNIGNEINFNDISDCLYGFTTTPNNQDKSRVLYGTSFLGNTVHENNIGGNCSGDQVLIVNNSFLDNSYTGLNISGATNVTAKGNIIIDNGKVTGTNGQINILNSSNVVFDGNRVSVTNPSSSIGSAYNLSITGSSENIIVINNDYGVIKAGGSAIANTGTGNRYLHNNIENVTEGVTQKSLIYSLIADFARTFQFNMNFYKGNGVGSFSLRKGTPASSTEIWSCNNSGVTNQQSSIQILGTQVVTSRQPAVANATDADSAITQLNLLLTRLRTHGLIEP